jgi:hypothetical protein
MIDYEMLRRLRDAQGRTGLSVSEQVRRGINWWLEAHEWPVSRRSRQSRSHRATLK